MSFRSKEQSPIRTSMTVNTNGMGAVQSIEALTKKAIKKSKKIKDGTDGIDALDEIEDSDRLSEGFALLNSDE
jgi:hypothetical protein